jgi:hypothetical protein
MGSRDKEHEAWNLQHGLKPNEHLALVCPRCARPHVETLTNDPSQPDYHHHVHQCTYCGLRFDLYVRTRSTHEPHASGPLHTCTLTATTVDGSTPPPCPACLAEREAPPGPPEPPRPPKFKPVA